MSAVSLPSSMAAEAARYDDEALIHLANRGLARRAAKLLVKGHDVEVPDDGAGVTVRGEGWQVVFETGQPLNQGRCQCSTVGACQHLVAAIIALRSTAGRSPHPGPGEPKPDDPAPDDSGPGDLGLDDPGPGNPEPHDPAPEVAEHDGMSIERALLGLADDQLLAWTRKADGRWALERAAGLELDQVVIDRGVNLGVDLPPPHGSVRFFSADLEAAVVKPATRHQRRTVGLAVLALWLTGGRNLPAASTDAGVPAAELPAERAAVVARAQELASNLIRVGLLHVGDREREQLDSLAASARGAKLYRLSLLAERASDHVVAITELSPQGDSATLLNRLAEIAVVAESIEGALGAGRPPADGLVGRARARFENVGQLDLAAAGHYTWGDHRFAGTTGVLFDRGIEGGNRAYTVAKPRVVAGRSLGDDIGWTGAGSVAGVTGNRVIVSNVKASDELRLSTSESVTATIGSTLTQDDLAALAWDGSTPPLGSRLMGSRGSGWRICPVDEHDRAAGFDPITQQLEWRFVSRSRTISASLPYRAASAQAITNLEQLVGQATVRYVIGRLRVGGSTGADDDDLAIWPISVFTTRLVNLCDDSVDHGWLSQLTAALGRAGSGSGGGGSGDTAAAVAPAPSAAERIGVRLARQAERGEHPTLPTELEDLARTARSWGFGVVADVLTSAPADVVALLRAAWTLLMIGDTTAVGDSHET